ncbi:MAG TPA: MATE family efflux transporter [Polyangiaceae bacterium]|nr:MATE family efflux transporter [Polyangiaceae bacterium]
MNDSSPSASDALPPGFWATIREAIRGSQLDFTKVSVGRAAVLLAVPMVLEMSMESLFAVADIFWVSRLGSDAVATVGLTESMLSIIYAVAMGLSAGATALVARRIGEKNHEEAAKTAVQAIGLGAVLSIGIGAAGASAAPSLLAAMGASTATVRVGANYTAVMLGGNATIVLLFIANAVFRGAGDAAAAMRTLWLANLLNIALGPCLIFGWGPFPALGVTGAAVATNIGRGIGVSYQLVSLFRKGRRLTVGRRHLSVDFGKMMGLVRLAGTATFQTLIETASWLGLVRILASFGSAALAGYTIAIRIALFALLPSWGMANAAATLVGQNLGARQPERAERSVWLVGLYNLMFLGLVGAVFVALPEPLVRWFTTEPDVLPLAADCLRVVALGFLFFAYGMVLVQAFNGAGDTLTPTVVNFVCFWLIKIPLAYLFSKGLGMGPHGVFVAVTVAYSVQTMAALWLFRRGRWKTKVV